MLRRRLANAASLCIVRKNLCTAVATGRQIHTMMFDGGSRGNPGVAGAGAVIFEGGDAAAAAATTASNASKNVSLQNASIASACEQGWAELWHGHFYVGADATNNQAEYQGIIEGLRAGRRLGLLRLHVQGDSELVLKQMTGVYKARNPRLQQLLAEASALVALFPSGAVTFQHVPRARNTRADELSNVAMDRRDASQQLAPGARFCDETEAEAEVEAGSESPSVSVPVPVCEEDGGEGEGRTAVDEAPESPSTPGPEGELERLRAVAAVANARILELEQSQRERGEKE